MDAPTVAELEAVLVELATFLEARSMPEAEQVRRSADEVGRSDAHGARRYLRFSRALLDVYFSPANGNARDEAEARELQERFDALNARAYSLAGALLRASASPGPRAYSSRKMSSWSSESSPPPSPNP